MTKAVLLIKGITVYIHQDTSLIIGLKDVLIGGVPADLNIVSVSTSENQIFRSGVKFSPDNSSMVRSRPPLTFNPVTTGIGVTGTFTGPIPSQNVYSARAGGEKDKGRLSGILSA